MVEGIVSALIGGEFFRDGFPARAPKRQTDTRRDWGRSSDKTPPASGFRPVKAEIGLDRVPCSQKNCFKLREFLFPKKFSHGPGMLEVPPEIFNRLIMVGVDNDGVRDINSLVPRIEDALCPILVLCKIEAPEGKLLPDLSPDAGTGICEPDERIGVSLIVGISHSAIDPFLAPGGQRSFEDLSLLHQGTVLSGAMAAESACHQRIFLEGLNQFFKPSLIRRERILRQIDQQVSTGKSGAKIARHSVIEFRGRNLLYPDGKSCQNLPAVIR